MKIAHMAVVTPHRCGLYETTRELVKGERLLGIDARIVDPQPTQFSVKAREEDRGVPIADMDFAVQADLIANHSGFDGTPVDSINTPVIHFSHGRPLSTFLGECDGGPPAYNYILRRRIDERFKGVVTFWPKHDSFLINAWDKVPVFTITPPVDMKVWTPGVSSYDFSGKGGDINVVITDPPRKDVSSFGVIHAFMRFAELHPGSKLHVYARDANEKKGYGTLWSMLRAKGWMGEIQGWSTDLLEVYRSADLLISPQNIWTRSLRESMACGCQVVSGMDSDAMSSPDEFASLMDRRLRHPEPTRELAEAYFNTSRTANEFMAVVRHLFKPQLV